jgi:hypothetical protein
MEMLQSSSLIQEMCLPLAKLAHRWGQLERAPMCKLEEKSIDQICVRLITKKLAASQATGLTLDVMLLRPQG